MQPGQPGSDELRIMLQEGRRMKKILADLRGFLRPGGPERAPADLNGIVEEVLALIRHDAEKTRVTCACDLAPGGLTVRIASDQIRQAVLNLALNALQAMPDGGKLKIAVSTAKADGATRARIVVEDTGPGIPADLAGKVTDPFFTTKPGRMGLGLAICKDVVEKHAGSVRVESEPGRGARITLDLPAEAP
jgi:signal transduction histidine kinase